jgi:PKD repeat protein
MRLAKIVGDSEAMSWSTQIWNEEGNNGFTVVDANKDNVPDIATILGGNLALLNGRTGALMYTLSEVFSANVTGVAIVSDVDGNGINEVAIRADKTYLVSFGSSSYQILWQKSFGSEGIDSIQDVNGDGYKDVIAATSSQVNCFVGSTPDTTPPVANAGPDQIVNEKVQVQFDGSRSTDNIGITSYVWTLVDGTAKTLDGSVPTYTFSNPGIYTVTLNVSDAVGNWATDAVTITVRDITPPTIGTPIQSPSGNVGEGQLVTISANITDAGTGVKNATLIYSNDNGTSWQTPLRMIYNSTTSLYETTIVGHISGTWVKYKITAYDNAGNLMTENNAGQYYSYQVIPEFPATYVILLFILATTLAVTSARAEGLRVVREQFQITRTAIMFDVGERLKHSKKTPAEDSSESSIRRRT